MVETSAGRRSGSAPGDCGLARIGGFVRNPGGTYTGRPTRIRSLRRCQSWSLRRRVGACRPGSHPAPAFAGAGQHRRRPCPHPIREHPPWAPPSGAPVECYALAKLTTAASPRKPAWLLRKSRLRGGQTLATWIGHSCRYCRNQRRATAENMKHMSVRQTFFAATTVSIVAFSMAPASAQSLRYSNQGDLKSLDPYTLNETTTHSHLGQVYEG